MKIYLTLEEEKTNTKVERVIQVTESTDLNSILADMKDTLANALADE